MTPEGRVKERVKEIIRKYRPHVYSHWPVLNGMGAPTLDCIGCAAGTYFAVETKAPGKHPTPRQLSTIQVMRQAGAMVFIIRGADAELQEFDRWLLNQVALRQRVMDDWK